MVSATSSVGHWIQEAENLPRHPQQHLPARNKRRSGQRARVRCAFILTQFPFPGSSLLLRIFPYKLALTPFSPNSQGQGQPRRHSRQSHLGQTLQRRPILPPHHSCHACRQTEDQWQLGTESAEWFGGEGTDQEGGWAQQAEHLQWVLTGPFEIWDTETNISIARAVTAAE